MVILFSRYPCKFFFLRSVYYVLLWKPLTCRYIYVNEDVAYCSVDDVTNNKSATSRDSRQRRYFRQYKPKGKFIDGIPVIFTRRKSHVSELQLVLGEDYIFVRISREVIYRRIFVILTG